MQAESGVRMHSTHKGKKTYYLEARDESIHSMEFDALIVPSLKQDLIGGRAVTNGLDFQVILVNFWTRTRMSAEFILA